MVKFMEKLNEKIIEILNKYPRGLSFKELEKALDVKTSSDFAILSKTMDQLERDFVVVREKSNAYQLAEQTGFITGVVRINSKGVGYIDLEDDRSIMIEPEDLNGALDRDTVVVGINKRTYNYVVKAVRSHAIEHAIGTFVQQKNGALKCVLDDVKLNNHLYKITLPKDLKPTPGLKVMLDITEYGRLLKLTYRESIGYKDDPGIDILSVLLDYDIVSKFPDEVIQEANAVNEVSEEEKKDRTDLTEETIITIDGDSSKDFDDAVGVIKTEDGWILKVNIADVSHYVKENSELDKEALKRGTSTYVTDRVVPMLPQVLSNGICSLNPDEVRLTLTCEMHVGKNGEIKDYRIYPSFIKSHARMTYANVNKILFGDPKTTSQYEFLNEMLHDLRDCADSIRKQRHEKGAIDFETQEAEIIVNDIGYPVDIRVRERGHAERIIEDCMIAANVSVADYMNKNQIPCLYRVHGEPEIKKLRNFEETSSSLGCKFTLQKANVTPKEIQSYLEKHIDDENYPILSTILLRCMQKAKYDAKCLGHFGLAEEEYLHFTSPIRRYPDLVVHRMLWDYVFKNTNRNKETDAKLMNDYAEQTSLRERESIEAEREVEDMKKAEYMIARVGQKFEATISSVTSFGFFAELPNTVEGLVSITSLDDDYYIFDSRTTSLVGTNRHKRYGIGDKVKIVVLAADKDTRRIDFGLDKPKKKVQREAPSKRTHFSRRKDDHSRNRKDDQKRGGRGRGKQHGKRRK